MSIAVNELLGGPPALEQVYGRSMIYRWHIVDGRDRSWGTATLGNSSAAAPFLASCLRRWQTRDEPVESRPTFGWPGCSGYRAAAGLGIPRFS